MTNWTDDQKKAISAPTGEGNILVSAAAGSGKTAVLVERIMSRIRAGASIDRLLVVTFTNAAAAEMREKIIKQLSASYKTASGKTAQHLKKQMQLAGSADIMTIDAFCIRVVENNFHVLGADPGMAIADQQLAELIASDAMEDTMSELYRSNDADEHARLERLVNRFSSMRDDSNLCGMVRKIHNFITSFAEPESWLDDAVKAYRKPILETPYAKKLYSVSKNAAEDCIRDLDAIKDDDDDVNEYIKALRAVAEGIRDAQDWDTIYDLYRNNFKTQKKKDVPIVRHAPKKNEQLIFTREVFVGKLDAGVTMSLEDLKKSVDLDLCAQEADDLVWLVKRFMTRFREAKDKRGVREFSDVEHMTYRLFNDFPDIRAAYRDKYDEILIDEYQDTNGLQDSIFALISDKNIFMVGDLKQSIYLFRGGDPYIFKAKSNKYQQSNNSDLKLTLAQNFRSRQEILKSVNDVFTCIMSAEAGDVNYSGDELITRDMEREYYPPAGDCSSELHYIMTPPKSSSEDQTELELKYTADQIAKLLKSGTKVFDTSTGSMRPIQKRDIVILEYSTRKNGDKLVSELAARGIDAYCDTDSFFNRREIKTMLSLLEVINNASLDIPLIAVMRSPIWNFTDNELALIRLASQGSFSAAVRWASSDKETSCPGDLKKKCKRMCDDINSWRNYVRHKSVAQLIWAIYEQSGFYDIMGAIDHTREAQFNLRLLYERAVQFERAGFKGLFSFIKYIKTIEELNSDIGGAKLISENHDVVRIMTIHKSKGLEFPFVFLLGSTKKLSNSESFSDVRLHKDLMMGLCEVHHDKGYKRESGWYGLIQSTKDREYLADRMRLLYVALTRAREKLFVTVTVNEDDTAKQAKHAEKLYNGRMLPTRSLNVRSFDNWICPAAFSHTESWKTVRVKYPSAASDAAADTAAEESAESPELRDAVFRLLDYKYPYNETNTLPSRTSVTQIKELTIERESLYDRTEYEPDSRRVSGTDNIAELMFSPLHQKPAFMREKDDSKPANEIGTLYHLVMSEIDLDRIRREGTDCVEDELKRLAAEKLMTPDDLTYIKPEKIACFFNSPLGKRMLASSEIRREAPFQINISAAEYDPSLTGCDGETVILQGIIDCFFREGDGYILYDYKTDKVYNNADELRRTYSKQLELYTKAIETLTGVKVKEAYLYLFDIGETV